MSVRIEHDDKGQHRSSFSNHESVDTLSRVLIAVDVRNIVRIVITYGGKELRLVPEKDNGETNGN